MAREETSLRICLVPKSQKTAEVGSRSHWALRWGAAAAMLGMVMLVSSSGSHAGILELLGGKAPRTQLVGMHPEVDFAASARGMKQEFDDAFRRGELSSSALIHIDVPIRKWRFGFSHGQNLVPPDTPKLTRVEAETKEELENDPGGLARLKSSGKHMANRINGIINSLQNKLDTAAKQRLIARTKFIPAGGAGSAKPLGSGLVTPAKDLDWDRDIRKLNAVIRNHGGVPKPHRMHHWSSLTSAEESAYQDALRNAFGKKPPTGMGVF